MARRVFFCFHYQDVIDFRANVVRNHWVTKPDREAAGYFDASIWESAKRTGEIAVKRVINDGLRNTSVTTVLIGTDTYNREWVRYEIVKSIEVGNKLIGVHINQIPDKYRRVKINGPNPFDYLGVGFNANGDTAFFWEWNGRWAEYSHIRSIQLKGQVDSKYRANSFRLSDFYRTYCWSMNDGYSNFADWVD